MKTKNFRIGNLVKSGKGIYKIFAMLSIPQILAIQKYDEPMNSQLNVYPSDSTIIEPIEINEYILRNLIAWEFVGFGTRIIYKHTKFSAIEIEMRAEDVAVYFNDELISFKKHLHELQNLFFALTNEELQFKNDM